MEEAILSQQEVDDIFSLDFENFLCLSQVLLYDLLDVQDKMGSDDFSWPAAVDAAAQVFLKYVDLLKTYKDYISTASNRLALLRKLTQQKPQFDKFLQSVRINLQKCHLYDDLVSLLCRPSRQATVYLQAFELLKTELPDSKPVSDALAKVKDVLRVIGTTDSARTLEFHRLHELQERIEGRVNLLAPHRVIEYEETVTLIEEATDNELDGVSSSPGGLQSLLPKTKLHLVLMNDALLITVSSGSRASSTLEFERLIPLADVTVQFLKRPTQQPDPKDDRRTRVLRFEVFGWTYAVKCGSEHNREMWESRITRCQMALQKTQESRIRAARQSLTTTSPRLSTSASSGNLLPSTSQPNPDPASSSAQAPKSPSRGVPRLRSATLRNTIQDTLIDYKDKIHLVLEILGQCKAEQFTPTPIEKRMPLFVGSNGAILGREMPTTKPNTPKAAMEQRAGFLLIPDEAVSRQHCVISFSGVDKKFYLRDLGSANNSFILKPDAVAQSGPVGNFVSMRLAEPTGTPTPNPGFSLFPGCVFQIGSTRLRVESMQTVDTGDNSTDTPSPPAMSPIKRALVNDRQRSQSTTDNATLKTLDHNSNVLLKLGLIDPGAAGADSSSESSQEESKAKRVEVYVNEELRGMALVYPRKNFMALRSQIFRLLLTDSERDSVGSNWKSLAIRLNGRLSILPSQNKIIAYDAIEPGDKISVSTKAPTS
eukprot:TRINITY_DN7293_c0_g1_i1.p1 TRINITY_DN7293_c0_g1~~TRINITY_DN7293_c0_g1_i1.p1  ORF type:complete len:786 (+),score=130.54 TRINITY_DN7293_c0_g1_i1:231-2360(+)